MPLGGKVDTKHGGIRIRGCGMNMGDALVYDLGATLWPHGTPEIRDGGYALKQIWL